MTVRSRDTKAILRTIERSERRSTLFWWMVEHHDELVEASRREPFRWAAFCAEAAKRRLRDTRGEIPSERNARETWRQARKFVANTRAAQAAAPPAKPGSVAPSRIPKDWKPTPSHPEPQPSAQPLPASQGAAQPYDRERALALLRRTLEERSGRR